MTKPQFTTDHIYHLYNRGVEKRDIFLNKQDYLRFIDDLFEFNDREAALPSNVRFILRKPRGVTEHHLRHCLEVQPLNRKLNHIGTKHLVEILCYALMPNHFHLMVRQLQDGGISKFMQKLGTGYTMYFNQKYERVGGLFQGGFKAKSLERDAHFLYLPYYIHFNPLDLSMPSWRDGLLRNYQKAMNFLDTYRWSSHLDYAGKKNFPSIISTSFLKDFLGQPSRYRKSCNELLVSLSLEEIQDVALD